VHQLTKTRYRLVRRGNRRRAFYCVESLTGKRTSLGADALSRPPGIKSLRETFATKEEFLRQVPRLIIEHNIHGIDIDPRCAQIAGLSLWQRAQRAWKDMGLKSAERPTIKRSNIVHRAWNR